MKFSGILIGGWVAAGAALTLAGCSGSSSGPKPADTAAETVTAPTTMADTGCASGSELADRMGDPRVSQIRVLGDCQTLSVSTVLTDNEADLARLVCEAAVQQAAGAFGSVKVISDSGTVLATGADGRPCAQ